MKPSPIVADQIAYRVPRHPAPMDLRLDGNEGPAPDVAAAIRPEALSELCRRYPDPAPLEAQLAERFGVRPEQVLVTAGADDALDRACRALLAPGRELVMPVPTFEMLGRYARWAGASITTVPCWDRFPLEAVLAACSPQTAAVAIVSPNNPTGVAASPDDLRAIAEAAPQAALFVDAAYAEFADTDLTGAALALPNAIVFRTLSKAWGLAGLRIGYAIGPAEAIGWMRAAGHPYAMATTSLAIAAACVARGLDEAVVARIARERDALSAQLAGHGFDVPPSRANFVLARGPRAAWLSDGLAGLGIAVRRWPGDPRLGDCVRITCPAGDAGFARLTAAIDAVLAPDALLFDMDGVLVDVRASYRQAIVDTLASFEVVVDDNDVTRAKAAPDSNNDWVVTQRLLAERGRDVPLAQVTERFEELYQGTDAQPGLWQRERLSCDTATLEGLARRIPLGIVTGRPRSDAERFLAGAGVAARFSAMVCMGDTAGKPSPEPVQRALATLGATRAWLIGDTPDDVRAARSAGVVPIGFSGAGGQAEVLLAAGAARVIDDLTQLEDLR